MGKPLKLLNLKIILLSTIAIFFLSYIYVEVHGIEFTEKGWGIKFQVQDPWNITSNSEKDNLCNNELKCLIVLDNTLEDESSTITILAEKGQEFENKCQCTSLLEFVQFDYNKTFSSIDDFYLINDNQTTLNENISAWQMEYNNTNKNNNNIINHLVLWTINNNIFYKISYHGNIEIYSKYLPSLKEFLASIKFVKPEKEQESKEVKIERKPLSFMFLKDKNETSINNDFNQSIIDENSDLLLDQKKNLGTIVDSDNTMNTMTNLAKKPEFFSNIRDNNYISNESLKQENSSTVYEGLGLQINYHPSWTIFEDSLTIIQGENKNEIRTTQNKLDTMMIKYGCKCDTLEEYARYIYTNQISKLDDFSFINDNQTTISDNIPAIQLEYERSIGDTKIHEINIISKFQDSFYQFSYYADVESFSEYLHEFKKMIDTIKFFSQNESKEKQPSFMKDYDQLEQTDNDLINNSNQLKQTEKDSINYSTNKLDEIRAVLLDVDKNCNSKNTKSRSTVSQETLEAIDNILRLRDGGTSEDWCKQGMGWLKIECDNHYDESQLCQANMPSIKKFLSREYIDDSDAEYLHNQYEKRLDKNLTTTESNESVETVEDQ